MQVNYRKPEYLKFSLDVYNRTKELEPKAQDNQNISMTSGTVTTRCMTMVMQNTSRSTSIKFQETLKPLSDCGNMYQEVRGYATWKIVYHLLFWWGHCTRIFRRSAFLVLTTGFKTPEDAKQGGKYFRRFSWKVWYSRGIRFGFPGSKQFFNEKSARGWRYRRIRASSLWARWEYLSGV